MAVRLGDDAPNFTAETTEGTLDFYDWKGDSWAVLFSHPKDFTPVCTTELGAVAGLKPEFDKRGVKVIEDVTGNTVNFPLIADEDHSIAEAYDMLPNTAGVELAEVMTVRSVFVIGPDNKVKLSLTYPASTGRNFDEVIRVIDSLQLTAKHKVATPADWKQGEDVIITGAVSNEEADEKFPGYETVKPYLRTTKQPS